MPQKELTSSWERQRLKLMETLLRDKFRRDSALRERLLRTETKNLIANNSWGETFWGVPHPAASSFRPHGQGALFLRTVRVF